ncbi:16S rRNA (guanine1207-N2)-methyltransferase [Pullulanibacillus pueri]|uniref:16S RNA G1207 methylase RsmC n=1 Tax=Pullulanibacillus pueri TaxID=1437324 RepID=A0A8J3EN42_9BACL|nr:class I SAM-dependent methyltransferase [Pullulanibacillus pueri]MBM7683147.1 16S rRNA (guanine1207-N2)-methyltransferase [Pullulanibacillus pueri]GGH85421.1 16S RNA G1207 methylase RsmC [Pullulanibacillus pueri]
MADHYYTRHPSSESQPQTFRTELKGETFAFKTDSGVFSKADIDFGSRLLIDSLVQPSIDGPILDMGCGYGPIGISLARFWEGRSVSMVDVNERAVGLTKENAEKNKVRVDVFQSNLYENVSGKYALIVTNPPIRAGKKVIFQLFEASKSYLLEGGELWIVIQKKQGAPSTLAKLETLFGQVEVVTKKKGYFIIKATFVDERN